MLKIQEYYKTILSKTTTYADALGLLACEHLCLHVAIIEKIKIKFFAFVET